MSLRSIAFSSLFALSFAVPVFAIGCAAPTDDGVDSEEQVAETQDELTAAASQLVGSYYTHAPGFGGFARLELKTNGKYIGQVDGAGKIVCITSPCVLPESGTWNASKRAGGYRLRVTPAGKATRYYETSKAGQTLTLNRSGITTTLSKLAANECLDSADCKATEECQPKACLMYCAAGDPFCCGTSTCQPKATEACFGAWLDQFGGCRGAADQGLPASCCADLSAPCGTTRCGVGKVCCNSLEGLCTNPGEVCIQ